MAELTLEQQRALAIADARRKQALAQKGGPVKLNGHTLMMGGKPLQPVAPQPPEGMFYNPETGQYTSRELLTNHYSQTRGQGDAAITGGAQGVSLGAMDEIVGGVTGLIHGDQAGHAMTEKARAAYDAAIQEYPATTITSEIGGAVVVPGGAVKGATRIGTAGRAAGYGGLAGGLYASNTAEGNLGERAKAVPTGMAFGAAGGLASIPIAKVLGAAGKAFGNGVRRIFARQSTFDRATGQLTDKGRKALEAAGLNPDEVTGALAKHFDDLASSGVEPQAAARAADLAEQGIPAYRANVTGAVNDFADMEAARRGAMGQKAATKVGEALDTQDTAMRAAGDRLAESMGGGARGDQFDAATAISNRLGVLADEAKGAAKRLYDTAERAGFAIDADVAKNVAARIQTRLADDEVDLTSGVFSQSRSFMRRLVQRGSGDKPVSLRLVEGMRKDIVRAMSRAEPEDARALGIMKAEYDGWIDQTVEAALFSGDEKAIPMIKQARAAWSDYMRKFGGQGKGDKFIRDMVDAEASPDDVVRWLFSAGKLGGGRLNSTLAKSLKDLLGADSQEWGLFRQAALRKLIEKPEGTVPWGAQKIRSNILEFFNSPATRALSQEIFTKEQSQQARRFAGTLQKLIPPPGAVNHSGTAYENTRMVRRVFEGLAGAVGLASGPQGAIAGAALAKSGHGLKDWLKTRAILKGVVKPHSLTGSATGGAAGSQSIQGP